MRQRLVYVCFLTILFSAHPRLSLAQFQEPTKDELQMTGASGEDAIYLYSDETTDDATHLKFFHDRIKVLTEKGKQEASITSIPYLYGVAQLVAIEARTIHPDGTVVAMTGKPNDMVDVKVGKAQVNKLVITFPSVEVGSILEYWAEFRNPKYFDSQPYWDIQQAYPVRKAHYSFHPSTKSDHAYEHFDRLIYGWHLPAQTQVKYNIVSNTYTLDVNDVPPLPNEDWMAPLNMIKYKVEFYYIHTVHQYNSDREFWTTVANSWAEAASELTKPTGDLRKAAASLVASTDSTEEKARKIYAAVQQLDNTDFSRTKSKAELKKQHLKEIRHIQDVWKQRRGSGDDIALLFVALARALELPVYAAHVVDRSQSVFDEHYLSIDQLDDFIAILDVSGKEIYLDPGQKMIPFGLLHWKHTLTSGLRMGKPSPSVFDTPAAAYQDSIEQRISDLYLDQHGAVTGSVRFIMTGYVALYWRQLALENDAEELKKQFNEVVRDDLPPGVHSEFDHFLGLDDPTSSLAAIVKLSGDLGAPTGKRLLLPALPFQAKVKYPFVSEVGRVTPVDVHYPMTEEDRITYHLPNGFELESVPSAVKVVWPNRAAINTTFTSPQDSTEVTRTLVYTYTVLDPTEYTDLHNLYRKIAAADQQQLVLRQAKPN